VSSASPHAGQTGGINLTNSGGVNFFGPTAGGNQTFNYNYATAPSIIIPHEIPSPPADFVRREQLIEQVGTSNSVGFVIYGMAGAGKTVFALKLAEELKSNYPDCQFYLDLEGTSKKPLSRRAVMAHIIRSLQPDIEIPKTRVGLKQLYTSALQGKRAILFLDNVKDEVDLAFLHPPRGVAIIVTSRSVLSLPGYSAIRVGTMLSSEAESLLLKICPRVSSAAHELAKVCGYLPYALRTAASTLARYEDLNIETYLQELKDAEKRLTLTTGLFDLSYQLLDPEARAQWRTLAICRAGFDAKAAAAVWSLDLPEATTAISELLRSNLLEWDRDTQRYSFNDLTSTYAESLLTTAERALAELRHAVYYADMANAAILTMSARLTGSVRNGFRLLYADWLNISAGQSWAAKRAEEEERAARLSHDYAWSAAFFYLLKQDTSELVSWLEAALRGDRRWGSAVAEADDLISLGNIRLVRKEAPAATECYEQALKIRRTLKDRAGEADALSYLMRSNAAQDALEKAAGYGEAALEVYQQLGAEAEAADSAFEVGNVFSKKKEPKRALDLFRTSLQLNERLARPDNEARSLVALSEVTEDRQEAIFALQKAADLFHELGEASEECRAVFALEPYLMQGKEYHKVKDAAIRRALLATTLCDKKMEAHAWMSAATACLLADKWEESITLAERSLALSGETAEECVVTLAVLVSAHGPLSKMALFESRLDTAKFHAERQLAAAKKLRAANRPYPEYMEATALSTLGQVALKNNEISQAKAHFAEGVEIAHATQDEREEAKLLRMLAGTRFLCGDRLGAIECSEKSVALLYNLNDPSIRDSKRELALYRTANSGHGNLWQRIRLRLGWR
jgi:NB-ARC domain